MDKLLVVVVVYEFICLEGLVLIKKKNLILTYILFVLQISLEDKFSYSHKLLF